MQQQHLGVAAVVAAWGVIAAGWQAVQARMGPATGV
jgi:hypothetical protein